MIMSIDLFQMFHKYGITGIILGITFLLLSGILKSNWFHGLWAKATDKIIEWFIKSRSSTEEVKHIVESDIINHDIFNYIDFWMYSKVPTMQFSTEYRTVVFRKYLIIYLRCYKNSLADFVKDGKYKTMDQPELWKNLMNTINSIIRDYELACKEAGIPDVVISKTKSKNNDTIKLTIDLIESISNSYFYQSENNYLKIYSILNIILSVLESTMTNSELICNSINGQLKGLTMDGKKEP